MFKALACTGLVGYTHAQTTAVVTNYSTATPSIKDSSANSIATTSVAMEISEVIDGANSVTAVEFNMNFTLGTGAWTGAIDEQLQLMVCAPVTVTDEEGAEAINY